MSWQRKLRDIFRYVKDAGTSGTAVNRGIHRRNNAAILKAERKRAALQGKRKTLEGNTVRRDGTVAKNAWRRDTDAARRRRNKEPLRKDDDDYGNSGGSYSGDGGSSRGSGGGPSSGSPESILGVDRGATKAQIKAAFRRMAQKTHPDKGGSAELFKTVQNAYEQLMAGATAALAFGVGQRRYSRKRQVARPRTRARRKTVTVKGHTRNGKRIKGYTYKRRK